MEVRIAKNRAHKELLLEHSNDWRCKKGLVVSRFHTLPLNCIVFTVGGVVCVGNTHTQNQDTHLRDSVALWGVICACRRSVGGFYGPLYSRLSLPGKHWYLLIKFYPTLQ